MVRTVSFTLKLMLGAIALVCLPVASPAAGDVANSDAGVEAHTETVFQPGNLWPGEEQRVGAGYPFVIKYHEVDKQAPLIVFLPGAFSTGRAFYGGSGTRSEDFVAHWVAQRGYNFLAISYPLVTSHGMFTRAFPEFTTQDWGKGSAEITQGIVEQHKLEGDIIVAVWSMGGKSIQPYGQAALDLGLDLNFHVALAATPAIPTEAYLNRPFVMHETGVLQGNPMFPRARAELQDNKDRYNLSHDIIPPDRFNDYWGYTPAQLIGIGVRYDADRHILQRDPWGDMQDTRFYAQYYPLVAAIVPTWQTDARHSMTDRASWGYINANTIFYRLVGGSSGAKALDKDEFQELRIIARQAHSDLAIDIEGNHFFFMGENGARATVDAIIELEARVGGLKHSIEEIVQGPKE